MIEGVAWSFALRGAQVIRKCGKLPLAVSMAGNLGRDDPQEPQCWRSVLDKLQDKEKMWRQMELTGDGRTLFPVIDVSFDMLPSLQRDQFKLMVVMAPRVPITPDMLANLWDTVSVRLTDVVIAQH